MRILLLAGLVIACLSANAQQDPMYTMYMFNPLSYNPAIAGSPEHLSIRALYRNQWWNFEGAPTTQSVGVHSPFGERIGLGLSLVRDQIGVSTSHAGFISYAYRMPFGNGKLNIGLRAGASHWDADFSQLNYKDPQSINPSFQNLSQSKLLPNFGVGVFYTAPKFYIGLSAPNLMEHNLRDLTADETTQRWASTYRHYFLATGATFNVRGDQLIFKPSILIKSVGLLSGFTSQPTTLNPIGAPVEFDIDLSLLFYEAMWLGVSFRSAFDAEQFGGNSSFDSADIWGAYYLINGLRIGASFDLTLTEIREPGTGSFEIMLGYDFSYGVKKINTPRYF